MKERKPNKGGGRAKGQGTQGRVRGNERPIEEGHGGRRGKMRKFRNIGDKETIREINTISK